jgi:hypothetical protein
MKRRRCALLYQATPRTRRSTTYLLPYVVYENFPKVAAADTIRRSVEKVKSSPLRRSHFPLEVLNTIPLHVKKE